MRDKEKAERVLWNYCLNVKKAEEMRITYSWLMSVRGQDYGAHIVNGVSDAVLDVVYRKMAVEKKDKVSGARNPSGRASTKQLGYNGASRQPNARYTRAALHRA